MQIPEKHLRVVEDNAVLQSSRDQDCLTVMSQADIETIVSVPPSIASPRPGGQ